METIQQANEALRTRSHECIDNGAAVDVPAMQPGTCWAQGDVGVLRLAELPAKSKKTEWPMNGQVAPGNTKGSRHIVPDEFRGAVQFYRVSDGDDLSDLAVEAKEPWTLTHPEHGDCTFQAGTYRLVHQQNEQRERVRD